ncbi:hypothetical protein LCGC14_0657400 [marine sediment metagenome]|uniref:Glycosyltransferase 2-like domain-containing protein n=1 Tax=marine sediment metagenome TaxID=412755 RepID=A0A0F9REF8_9ZZZZ
MQYVIGSGWWCDHAAGLGAHQNKCVGHPIIRSLPWHDIWKYFIFRYTTPRKVVIVDSASPVTPAADARIEFISLDRNYQYIRTCRGVGNSYNGWLRGFALGAWYAWSCSCDFIYVEQDCLVVGEDWPQALTKMAEGRYPLFGRKCNSPLQQSLVFLPYRRIPEFLHALMAIKSSASMICESAFFKTAKRVPFRLLPFGVGRTRPIDFSAKQLYGQHWTRQELMLLAKREGVVKKVQALFTAWTNAGA